MSNSLKHFLMKGVMYSIFLPVFFCILSFGFLLETRADWVQLGSGIEGEPEDYLGTSVSLSSDGTTIAIGAIKNSRGRSGLVRIYSYQVSSSTWNQVGSDIGGESGNDQFGYSVSLSADGSTVAIGA